MTPQGPLARRIAARRGEPVADAPKPTRRPTPPKPAWLERLQAKDFTGNVA